LQLVCYFTDFAVTYLTVIYFGYRGYMGSSAGQETLVGGIEFGRLNRPFYRFYTQFVLS